MAKNEEFKLDINNIPKVVVDVEKLQSVPRAKRIQYVVRNYLKSDSVIEKTRLFKYFVKNASIISSMLNAPQSVKLSLKTFDRLIDIYEMNGVVDNLFHIKEPVRREKRITNSSKTNSLIDSIF